MSSLQLDPIRRFSNRVSYYLKYRPGYPNDCIDLLVRELNIEPARVIADIGSGTGLLTELFLKRANTVLAVEPNREMREAAEERLSRYPAFRSIAGSAEATTLEAHSIDLVTVGHAFHWFDVDPTRQEFGRILKPGAPVVLLWNAERTESTAFHRAYEDTLRTFSVDYEQVLQRHPDQDALQRFFGTNAFVTRIFDNYQVFDYEGLEGRLLSSSFMPTETDPRYQPMIDRLRQVFEEHQVKGTVQFEYDTIAHYGRLV